MTSSTMFEYHQIIISVMRRVLYNWNATHCSKKTDVWHLHTSVSFHVLKMWMQTCRTLSSASKSSLSARLAAGRPGPANILQCSKDSSHWKVAKHMALVSQLLYGSIIIVIFSHIPQNVYVQSFKYQCLKALPKSSPELFSWHRQN